MVTCVNMHSIAGMVGGEMGRQRVELRPEAADAATVIGAKIRHARHAFGWTAEQLATAAAVSARTVRSMEAGEPSVAWGRVLNTLAVLRIPLFGMGPEEMRRSAQDHRTIVALIPDRTIPPVIDEDDDDF